MGLFNLAGQCAVVTGSTKGIGRGIAEHMVKAGACVVVSSRIEADALCFAEELNSRYGADQIVAQGVACDIEKEDDLENLITQAIKLFGKIDTLVCNAAIMPLFGSSVDTTKEDFDRIVGCNIYQAFRLSHLVFNDMKKRGNGEHYAQGNNKVRPWGRHPGDGPCLRPTATS